MNVIFNSASTAYAQAAIKKQPANYTSNINFTSRTGAGIIQPKVLKKGCQELVSKTAGQLQKAYNLLQKPQVVNGIEITNTVIASPKMSFTTKNGAKVVLEHAIEDNSIYLKLEDNNLNRKFEIFYKDSLWERDGLRGTVKEKFPQVSPKVTFPEFVKDAEKMEEVESLLEKYLPEITNIEL